MPRTPIHPGLPGYAWDARMGTGRWRLVNADGTLGRLVSARQVADTLRDLHARSEQQFAALVRLAVEGRISPATFQLAMADALKNLHTANAALAHGGWNRVPSAAWGRIGRSLRTEYRALTAFTNVIAAGDLSADAAAARAELYSDNAYGRYWTEDNRIASRLPTPAAVVTVGDERVCAVCTAAEGDGFVDPALHRIPLHSRCRCHKEYEINDA